jgi:hypothetical protein
VLRPALATREIIVPFLDHADAPAQTDRCLCFIYIGDGLGAVGDGRRAVPGDPRQRLLIGRVLRDRGAGLDCTSDATGELDERTAIQRPKFRIEIVN